jgi:hypothetical protein
MIWVKWTLGLSNVYLLAWTIWSWVWLDLTLLYFLVLNKSKSNIMQIKSN